MASTGSRTGAAVPALGRCCTRQRQMGHAAGRFRNRTVLRVVSKAVGDDDVVIPDRSYNLPLGFLGISAVAFTTDNLPLSALLGILGIFLAVQATRVKFKFSKTSLEVLIGEEQESTENVFVGGENKWTFDTFTNWELWWPNFPILVYFKETQTKPEGQIHFFPVLFDGKKLYEVMVERCGQSLNSLPK